jgi:hypothetical protein
MNPIQVPRAAGAGAGEAPPEPASFPLLLIAPLAALAGAFVAWAFATDPLRLPDTRSFLAIADSLMHGHGLVYREPAWPNLNLFAFRSPGYSTFLALTKAAWGIQGTVMLQGAMIGWVASLAGAVAARLAGRAAGWVAFALAMAWPYAWVLAGLLCTESLYTALSLTAVWLVMEAGLRRSAGRAVGGGLFAALAMLTRPLGLTVVPIMAVWLARRSPRVAIAFCLAVVLLWAPWVTRNAMRIHAFVPLQTEGGISSICGVMGVTIGPYWKFAAEHQEMGEHGLDRYFWGVTVREAAAHPVVVIRQMVFKFIRYCVPIDRSPVFWLHRFVLLLALVPVFLPAWRSRLWLPIWVWLIQCGASTAIGTNDRYRFPTDWVVAVMVAVGCVALVRRFGARRGALAIAGLVGVSVALLLVQLSGHRGPLLGY